MTFALLSFEIEMNLPIVFWLNKKQKVLLYIYTATAYLVIALIV